MRWPTGRNSHGQARSCKAVKGKVCKDEVFMNTPLLTGSDPHSAGRAGRKGKARPPARAASQVRLGFGAKPQGLRTEWPRDNMFVFFS